MGGMTLRTRIAEIDVLPGYRLRFRYADGASGIVEMTATVAKGGVFGALDGARFGTARLTQGGRAVCWISDAGDEVDFDADALRMRLKTDQAAAG